MFYKKALLILASSLLLVGCGTKAKEADDGQDYEQASSTEASGYSMFIIGSSWNSWTPETINETDDFKFTRNDSGKLVYDAVITNDMVGGWQGFKFIGSNSWSEQYGAEDLDIENCNQAYKDLIGFTTVEDYREANKKPTSDRSNLVAVTIEAKHVGTYHIEYDPTNFKIDETDDTSYSYHFVVNFTAAA